MTPQVGLARLAAVNGAELGQARVPVQSIHLRKTCLQRRSMRGSTGCAAHAGGDVAIRRSAPLRQSASGCQNPTHTRMARAAFRFRSTAESLEAHMTRLLLTVTFTAMLASLAEAQPVSDPRIADLVQAGKIRVGMHSIMYTKDSQTGELKAASTGIILLDV